MTHHNFITETSTLNDCIGHTPLVKLARFAPQTDQGTATLLAKLEGNNPAGSVKDRPAYNMFYQAERRGTIKPGDTIIEALGPPNKIIKGEFTVIIGNTGQGHGPVGTTKRQIDHCRDSKTAFGGEFHRAQNSSGGSSSGLEHGARRAICRLRIVSLQT